MIKKYEKKLTKEEEKQRKFKDRKIIKAYDVGFEGTKELLEVEIEENYYDEYEICYFSDDKIKKIKTKKTKIKNNEKIKLTARIQKCGEYIIYGRNVNKLIIIEAILGIFLLLSGIGFAYSNIPEFRETVEDFLIEKVKVDTPTAPVITGGSLEWAKERIIKIKRDAKSASGIKYYEYCISENEKLKNCNWQKTYTKNVVVSETGKFYIAFRGVSNDKSIGKKSNTEEVLIDNIAPKINDIKITNNELISIDILATDTHSGINKYYYLINDSEYKEIDKSFKLENKLEIGVYKLKIKVEDKAGNFSELELYIDEKGNILNREEINKYLENLNQNNQNGQDNDLENNQFNPDSLNNNTNNSGDISNNNQSENNSTNDNDNEKKLPPVINLDKVPTRINKKDEYKLPSHYEFDDMGGEVSCNLEDGTKVENTNEIDLGTHVIKCVAKGNNGLTSSVEKEIDVSLDEEGIWDGWITLTLYFPENSTDWEYRIADENEVRTKNNGWKEYTGPILVKLSQVDDVYIRYKINGKTYIISPKGKVVVDIEPQSYEVGPNQSTKVTITYDNNATVKEYRIDGGEWKKYEKPFNLKGNTLIEARAIKEEKVYDNEGVYQYTQKRQGTDSVFISKKENILTPGGTTSGGSVTTPGSSSNPEIDNIPGGFTSTAPAKAPTFLEGPTIINKQENEIVEETEIEITTQEKASKIYYAIEYGKYMEYKSPIKIKENKLIRAYYIRESDGKISETSYYYVQNIKQENMPYVRINVDPSKYLDTTLSKAIVTIVGQNYERLEYSFDGNMYLPYVNPLEITQSKTIYARAIDANNNVAETNTTIITVKPPKIYDTYDVSIHANPDSKNLKGLINKTKITIDYDKRAKKRYYKIGFFGDLKEYTGPFTLESNETIYAYATSENGNGETSLNVNYLTTGINAPIINLDTIEPTNSVKVSIDYAKSAESKKYKIDNGQWLDYNGDITVNENCTIYAKNTDILGNTNITSRRIKNIAYVPNYTLIDKGKYYIIHLNYPNSSEESSREYKWTSNGTWKNYNSDLGILLIKSSYKNMISQDGVKIKDDNGKEIIYTDHYYLVNTVTNNLMDDLFMRWDTGKPGKPIFILSEEEPTKELEVAIKYDSTSVSKLYKIVKPSGEDSGWADYNGPIKIKENGTIIYAKGQNNAEVWGEIGYTKIKNIDDEYPEITARGDFTNPKQRVTIQLVATDNLGVDKVGYKKGNIECSAATYIENMQTFIAEENGLYTICAKDKVGNTKKETIEITNVDKTAPDIAINILTKNYGSTLEFEVDYKDSKTKQYKLGNGEYKNYTGKVNVKAEDILNLKNEDGSLTIYAKGIDEAGNEKEVEEKTYLVDLDAPNLPVINASAGYPILTEYGVKYDDVLTVSYDKRDDIVNYISLDNGKNWKEYTGVEHVQSGTVMAKSVKKESGLTVSSTKKVQQPTDALPVELYDDDETTGVSTPFSKKLFISDKLYGETLSISGYLIFGGTMTITFYDNNNTVVGSPSTIRYDNGNFNIKAVIPENASYLIMKTQSGVMCCSSSKPGKIYEISIIKTPKINAEKYYSVLTEFGMEPGYNTITIDYYQTAVNKMYKINNGEWLKYNGEFRAEIGDVIEAKSIDKNGLETTVGKYTSTLPDDAISPLLYDSNEATFVSTPFTGKFLLKPQTYGETLSISGYLIYGGTMTITFYDNNNSIVGSPSTIKYDNGDFNNKVVIPENASYSIMQTQSGVMCCSSSKPGKIYEISIIKTPKINAKKYYSVLTEFGMKPGYNMITIDYYQTSVEKMYKINNGEWLKYNGEFRAEIGDIIEAKSIDKNGLETTIGKYTSTLPDDAISPLLYDSNEATFVSTPFTGKFLLTPQTYGKTLSISGYLIFGGTMTITFYDNNNSVVGSPSTIKYDNGDFNKKVVIPENASYSMIETQSGLMCCFSSKPGKIYEISVEQTSNFGLNTSKNNASNFAVIKVNSPKYKINILSASEKEVSINYPQGYTNEYSIDGGKTWNLYTEKIRLDYNTTVFARCKDSNNKIVSSSSIKITGIIKEEKENNQQDENESNQSIEIEENKTENQEEIKLDIPDEILVGENYELPTSGNGICKINEETINNTNELNSGNYEIKCYNNEDLIITKNIIIKEKE